MKKIIIIHPVPSFVNPITYDNVGPLDTGTIISIEDEVANLLIRKNRAMACGGS